MRSTPATLPPEGLLVGWSLEARRRKPAIGFTSPGRHFDSPAKSLEPILDDSEGHLFTVAPTGAGKGVGCIIPALLRYPGPVVVVDPKGENYAVTAARRRALGQKVVLLDPFGVARGADSQRFNPMDLADPASPHFVEDVSTLATLAAKNPVAETTHRELFWPQMGQVLVTAALLDVLTMPDSKSPTLGAARALLNQPLERLSQRAKQWQQSRAHPELRQAAGLLGNPSPETLGGFWAMAVNQLDFLKGNLIDAHLGGSDLDLNEVLAGAPMSIYLVLPPDKLESHAPLLRLWIGCLVTVLSRRERRPERPTLFLVDEAAQLGELPQLRTAITLLRGYGVRVWSFWQDLSQLQRLYPYDWETILNNCRIQQFFGATTGMAAKAVADVSGYGTRETVLGLEPDELILNVAGDEPVIARRPNYLVDPPFRGLFERNPFYGQNERVEAPRTRAVFRRSEAPAALHRHERERHAALLGQRMFHPVASEHWEPVTGDARAEHLRAARLGEAWLAAEAVTLRRCALPFYGEQGAWYEVLDERSEPARHAYFVRGASKRATWLDGASDTIYGLNVRFGLELAADNVLRYLRFYCTSILGEAGRFLVLNSAAALEWTEPPEASFLEALTTQITPPRILSRNADEGQWELEAFVAYGDAVYRCEFRVDGEGQVVMTEDEAVASDLPLLPDSLRLRYIGWVDFDGEFHPLSEPTDPGGAW